MLYLADVGEKVCYNEDVCSRLLPSGCLNYATIRMPNLGIIAIQAKVRSHQGCFKAVTI